MNHMTPGNVSSIFSLTTTAFTAALAVILLTTKGATLAAVSLASNMFVLEALH